MTKDTIKPHIMKNPFDEYLHEVIYNVGLVTLGVIFIIIVTHLHEFDWMI